VRFIRDAAITILAVVVVFTVFLCARMRTGGLSAEDSPGRVERTVATNLVRLAIRPDASRLSSPLADPRTWRSGADHFEDHCSACHGNDGRGHTLLGRNMYPKVPDLASPVIQGMSDGALFYVIENGIRWTGMPGWKGEHTPDESWRLVGFIRHLPAVSQEELRGLPRDTENSHSSEHVHDDENSHHQHEMH
jgi:mono/diheme cytochrome c family protein